MCWELCAFSFAGQPDGRHEEHLRVTLAGFLLSLVLAFSSATESVYNGKMKHAMFMFSVIFDSSYFKVVPFYKRPINIRMFFTSNFLSYYCYYVHVRDVK